MGNSTEKDAQVSYLEKFLCFYCFSSFWRRQLAKEYSFLKIYVMPIKEGAGWLSFRSEVICIQVAYKCLTNLVGRNEILGNTINGPRSALRW